MLKIENNKLILSPELVSLLRASPGDRLIIGFSVIDGKLFPVISKNEGGNVLTKSNTISFKGKQKEMLLQFGDEFTISPFTSDDTIILIGNKPVVSCAPVTETDLEEPLDISIILDTNYNITKFNKYEL